MGSDNVAVLTGNLKFSEFAKKRTSGVSLRELRKVWDWTHESPSRTPERARRVRLLLKARRNGFRENGIVTDSGWIAVIGPNGVSYGRPNRYGNWVWA